jgi:hypothetical protein
LRQGRNAALLNKDKPHAAELTSPVVRVAKDRSRPGFAFLSGGPQSTTQTVNVNASSPQAVSFQVAASFCVQRSDGRLRKLADRKPCFRPNKRANAPNVYRLGKSGENDCRDLLGTS